MHDPPWVSFTWLANIFIGCVILGFFFAVFGAITWTGWFLFLVATIFFGVLCAKHNCL